jgi:hypothetical protein
MDDKKTLIRKAKLDNMIAAYAEIWADVLLNKNLIVHLLNIEDDLRYVNQLIALKDLDHAHVPIYFSIREQLKRLHEIVVNKLSKGYSSSI